MSHIPFGRDANVISVDQLRAKLDRGDDVVPVHVGHLGPLDELREKYAKGHIPGARFVHLDTELAGPESPAKGENPLPTAADLQALVRDLGVHSGSTVVFYTADPAPTAARGWWVFRWGGLADVRYLDGGLAAWVAAGGELSTEEPPRRIGDAIVTVGQLATVDIDEAAAIAKSGLLIDARRASSYRGETTDHGYTVPGRIPGAVNRPNKDNLTAQDTLKSDAELAAIYADFRDAAGTVAVYDTASVGATLDLLALTIAGITAAFFVGSFRSWSADPSRPIAFGPDGGPEGVS